MLSNVVCCPQRFFCVRAHITGVDTLRLLGFTSLFSGVMMPYALAALTMRFVGEAL